MSLTIHSPSQDEPKASTEMNTVDQRRNTTRACSCKVEIAHEHAEEYKNDLIDNWAGDSSGLVRAPEDGELPKKVRATKKTTRRRRRRRRRSRKILKIMISRHKIDMDV